MSTTIALAILGVAHAQGPPPLLDEGPPGVSEFHSCGSPHTPPRGVYIALSKPCEFKFYEGGDGAGSPDGLSGVCSAGEGTNFLESRELYAMLWPDECVGNFERCYAIDSVGNGEGINVTESLLLMNATSPRGATHLSVNCTADREYSEAVIGEIADQITTLAGSAVQAFQIFSVALLIGCCGGVSACVWCYCIKPSAPPVHNGRMGTRTYQMAERGSAHYDEPIVAKMIV